MKTETKFHRTTTHEKDTMIYGRVFWWDMKKLKENNYVSVSMSTRGKNE